jgi:DDE superfamily endonuclease
VQGSSNATPSAACALPLSGSDRTSGHANGSVEHFCYRLGVALRSSLLARRIRRALVRADSVVPAISVDKDRNLRVVYAQVGRDLPAHKVAGVAEAIEAAGATLIYLPKYSPDFNPIELAFSKLKAHLRKAAEHTILRLLRRIGRVVTDFSPQECRNFFRHAGYARS